MLKYILLFSIILTTSFCSNNSTKAELGNSSTKTLPTSDVAQVAVAPQEEEKVSNIDAQAKELLQMVNRLRKKGCRCGRKRMKSAPPLKLNDLLNQAAYDHARDMATNNFFEHQGSNGSSVSDRISKTGYDWQAVGENIFWGDVEIADVFEGWKDSPSHCKNMMNRDFKEMGFGKMDHYWVQDLGKTF